MSFVPLALNDPAAAEAPVETPALRSTFRGLDVFAMPAPGDGLQLLVALRLLERLLPSARAATLDQWHAAVALAVDGACQAHELFPVGPEDMTPAMARYLVGDERIALLARTLQRGAPPPAGREEPRAARLEAGRRTLSILVQVIGGVIDRGLSLEEAVAAARIQSPPMVDGRAKLR